MRVTSLGSSDVRRVAATSGATAAVIVALLLGKPFHSAATTAEASSSPGVSQPTGDQELAIEKVSIVASPAIDTNSQFFVGCGDGSNGYYAERTEPAPVQH